MELFRFLAWQWKRLHYDEIAVSLVILVTVVATSIALFVSTFTIAVAVAVATSVIGFCFAAILAGVLTQWNKYKAEKDREAQKIMDKLAGIKY
jgi:uncharacterized membrane protein